MMVAVWATQALFSPQIMHKLRRSAVGYILEALTWQRAHLEAVQTQGPPARQSNGGLEMSQQSVVTMELIDAIQDAFNRHDVPEILAFFAEDCEWLMARGPDPWEAKRLHGTQATEDVLSARYAVIPDMAWVDMQHFISADGSRACSEWTVKGAPEQAPPINLLGCDV